MLRRAGRVSDQQPVLLCSCIRRVESYDCAAAVERRQHSRHVGRWIAGQELITNREQQDRVIAAFDLDHTVELPSKIGGQGVKGKHLSGVMDDEVEGVDLDMDYGLGLAPAPSLSCRYRKGGDKTCRLAKSWLKALSTIISFHGLQTARQRSTAATGSRRRISRTSSSGRKAVAAAEFCCSPMAAQVSAAAAPDGESSRWAIFWEFLLGQ